jgi:alkylation response protein AidB-like acyl-CoA dehydrogenase
MPANMANAGFATTGARTAALAVANRLRAPKAEEKILPKLAAGEMVGGYALGFFRIGCAQLPHSAELSSDGKHYSDGEKMWITNAGFADLFTVFAKMMAKFSAFLIEELSPALCRR